MPASAPTYNNFSALIDPVTTQQFMRGAFDNTLRRVIILKKLKEAGRIKGDASGKWFERTVRAGQYTSALRTDLAQRTFARNQTKITYAVPYSNKETTGMLSRLDVRFQQGRDQSTVLMNVRETMMNEMAIDFQTNYATDLLTKNGGSTTTFGQAAASGSPVPVFGLPTMFNYGAAPAAYNPDTQVIGGAVGAGDKEVAGEGTYCGVTLAPTGVIANIDNRVNEATSPVLVNWSSTAWGASGTTFDATCLEVLDYMDLRLTRSNDPDERADLFLTTRTMFGQINYALLANQRVILGNQSQRVDPKLNKDNTIPYGAQEIAWDASCPANVLYDLNTRKLEFDYFPANKLIHDDTLTVPSGEMTEMFDIETAHDIQQGAHLCVASLLGQLWGNPHFQGAAYNFA